MDDLIAFIKARLDEDEAAVKALDDEGGNPYPTLRAILRMHEPVPFWGNNPPPMKNRTPENVQAWYCECQCPDGVIKGPYPCDTARLIAAVYSDHPDYRPEWAVRTA